ncbi:MAG TPA: hypothetical protein PK306_02865 [Aquabacterium sp.]|jgi:hypothetical protein|uniref:hypothetical protein n=1 Tax=Comamonadaceae TaxID=80864 RepID=UPI001FCC3FFB|nr:hypothetical protein [Delftia lacustris]BDE73485.1 hypothetical protein HQS1_46090 [Delftia lacustris]HQC94633.1 hypothetical protein [Aquabacterium sp.]
MGYLNPLFKLPAAQSLLLLAGPEKAALARLMMDLRRQANDEAERAWKRRKGPMACYWRAVSTYARHVAHVLGHLGSVASDVDKAEMNRLQQELGIAKGQVALLLEAASMAVPAAVHPSDASPEGWALQLRALAKPRRTVATQLRLPLNADSDCGMPAT